MKGSAEGQSSLKNAQHEHFARLCALTVPPREAAVLAGIAPRVAARLAKRRDVRQRVRALEDMPALTVGECLAVAGRLFEAARQAVGDTDIPGGAQRSAAGAARRLAASVSPRRRQK